jgi:hypothetical protein
MFGGITARKVPSGGIEPSATSMLNCHAKRRRLLAVSYHRIQDRQVEYLMSDREELPPGPRYDPGSRDQPAFW